MNELLIFGADPEPALQHASHKRTSPHASSTALVERPRLDTLELLEECTRVRKMEGQRVRLASTKFRGRLGTLRKDWVGPGRCAVLVYGESAACSFRCAACPCAQPRGAYAYGVRSRSTCLTRPSLP